MFLTRILLALSVIVGLYVEYSHQQQTLKPFQLRFRFSKLQCEPVEGHEKDVQPCYDFSTKKLVPFAECNEKRNAHCCVHDCSCILKGAGNKKGVVPKQFVLPAWRLNKAKKSASAGIYRFDGCDSIVSNTTTAPDEEEKITAVDEQENTLSPTADTAKPTTKATEASTTTRRTAASTPKPTKKPVRKPPTKKPVRKPVTTKKPVRKPPTKKPVRRPVTTKKPVRRPQTQKPTRKPVRKPSTRKPAVRRPPTKKPTRKPVRKPSTKKPRPRPPTKKPLRRVPRTTNRPRRATTTNGPCTTTRKPFSFLFASRLSQIFGGFGISSTVVRRQPC